MSPAPDRLTIATRGSRLALVQADIVRRLLVAAHSGIEVEVLTVTTTGDRDARPFSAIGSKGLFTSEVSRAVLSGRADVAVHAAKDLTASLAPGAAIVCVPQRAQAADAVVGGEGDSGEERLRSLAPGARVGTSSMRRRVLLAEARPDLEVAELRGNLDTRLAKVGRGEVDAAVLAAAGLVRLGHDVPGALDEAWWVPAPAQGALAVEAAADRADLAELFAPLDDPRAAAEVACERAFAARLEGGCSVPLGCLARASGGDMVVTGFLGAPDASLCLRDRVSGPAAEAQALGAELAGALLAAGGDEVLADIAAAEAVEPSAP